MKTGENIAGCLVLFLLLRPALPFFFALVFIVAIIMGIYQGVFFMMRLDFTPYHEIEVEAISAERGSPSENYWEWIVTYAVHNQSSQAVDIRLGVRLPIQYSECRASSRGSSGLVDFEVRDPVNIHLEPGERISDTITLEHAHDYNLGTWKTIEYYEQDRGCTGYEIRYPVVYTIPEEDAVSIFR